MASKDKFKIFSANRLSFDQMISDVMSYIKKIYGNNGDEFTMASPFGQLINVVTHLGRMILFYIENTITELNIKTAYHERSIRGLATLTGHVPSSGIGARGSLIMTYNMTSKYAGQALSIKNYSKIQNTGNGLMYTMVLPEPVMRLHVGTNDSNIEIPIIQGEVKYQQATGTGEVLQSFNFANKSGNIVDNFFMNVYVNNERWTNVVSVLDMGFNQKCCIIKPSLTGGVDVFFGTGLNGAIPSSGATIVFEYLVCAGIDGNVYGDLNDGYWRFEDSAYTSDGDYIDLNSIYTLSPGSEILFGTNSENISITRKLIPNVSRSFVLGNDINYKYLLNKLNMFSVIDVFSGFATTEDTKIDVEYTSARENYSSIKESYTKQVMLTGKTSQAAEELYEKMIEAQKNMETLKLKYDDSKLDDNIIYLYLVPDITKRITSSENYFTCSVDRFKLSDDEKNGILNLIDDSGQKIITVENKILDPNFVNFAINIFVQIWSNYNFNAVKSSIINAISSYLISNTRRDRIPVSDLIRIVEGVSGVDSVSIYFDADKNNSRLYGSGNYGIDEYGDIILTRNIVDKLGNTLNINDIYPLFRGGFTSYNDIEYSSDLNSLNGPINITLRGTTD